MHLKLRLTILTIQFQQISFLLLLYANPRQNTSELSHQDTGTEHFEEPPHIHLFSLPQ